jgi:hypothetical protein
VAREARAARPSAANPDDAERREEDDECSGDETPRGTLDAGDPFAERPRKDERSGDQADGAQRGRGDVEPRLVHQATGAVQNADERRVDAVDHDDGTQDAERIGDVRGADDAGNERSQEEERRGNYRRSDDVDDERASQGRGLGAR